MREIIIEISDTAYEELLEKANELQKTYFDVCGIEISEGTLIRMVTELGIVPHIKCNMDIVGHNLRNRGAQNE